MTGVTAGPDLVTSPDPSRHAGKVSLLSSDDCDVPHTSGPGRTDGWMEAGGAPSSRAHLVADLAVARGGSPSRASAFASWALFGGRRSGRTLRPDEVAA